MRCPGILLPSSRDLRMREEWRSGYREGGCMATSRVLSAQANAVRLPSVVPRWASVSTRPLCRIASFLSLPSISLPDTMPKNTQNSSAASRHSLRRNQVQSFLSPVLRGLFILHQGMPHLPQKKAGMISTFFFITQSTDLFLPQRCDAARPHCATCVKYVL
jgi:hypothetical protein